MTAPIDAALRRYAGQLLAGTGLCADDAEPVAARQRLDVPPPASAAADALRDGWDTARLTAGQPSDPTAPVSRDRRAGR